MRSLKKVTSLRVRLQEPHALLLGLALSNAQTQVLESVLANADNGLPEFILGSVLSAIMDAMLIQGLA